MKTADKSIEATQTFYPEVCSCDSGIECHVHALMTPWSNLWLTADDRRGADS